MKLHKRGYIIIRLNHKIGTFGTPRSIGKYMGSFLRLQFNKRAVRSGKAKRMGLNGLAAIVHDDRAFATFAHLRTQESAPHILLHTMTTCIIMPYILIRRIFIEIELGRYSRRFLTRIGQQTICIQLACMSFVILNAQLQVLSLLTGFKCLRIE